MAWLADVLGGCAFAVPASDRLGAKCMAQLVDLACDLLRLDSLPLRGQSPFLYPVPSHQERTSVSSCESRRCVLPVWTHIRPCRAKGSAECKPAGRPALCALRLSDSRFAAATMSRMWVANQLSESIWAMERAVTNVCEDQGVCHSRITRHATARTRVGPAFDPYGAEAVAAIYSTRPSRRLADLFAVFE